jgi:hypothetical protein
MGRQAFSLCQSHPATNAPSAREPQRKSPLKIVSSPKFVAISQNSASQFCLTSSSSNELSCFTPSSIGETVDGNNK